MCVERVTTLSVSSSAKHKVKTALSCASVAAVGDVSSSSGESMARQICTWNGAKSAALARADGRTMSCYWALGGRKTTSYSRALALVSLWSTVSLFITVMPYHSFLETGKRRHFPELSPATHNRSIYCIQLAPLTVKWY